VSSNLKLRKKFKNWGICFETLSKLFVGVSSVLSFSSGIYKYDTLSFMAGTASVLSLVLLQYASFSYRESKKITTELNAVLSKLHIPKLIVSSSSYIDGTESADTPQSLNV